MVDSAFTSSNLDNKKGGARNGPAFEGVIIKIYFSNDYYPLDVQ